MAIHCNAAVQHKRTPRPYLFNNLHASSAMEGALRFALWAFSRREQVDAHAIQRFMGCSRGTSYRYLAALKAAEGRA